MTTTSPGLYADYHLARLLLLLDAFGGARRKNVEGLTKLAKLDFLLRYPQALKDLMHHRGVEVPAEVSPTDLERHAVESPMIRYRYGPWDAQYYTLIGRLVGMGLAEQSRGGRAQVRIRLTSKGRGIAQALRDEPEWALTARRASLLAAEFGEVSGAALKAEIYHVFNELLDRPYWSEIK